MARAVMRLDYTELPRGIRDDISKESQITPRISKENLVKERVYTMLHEKAKEYFVKIEDDVNAIRNTTEGFVLPEDLNDEDDKFYLTP